MESFILSFADHFSKAKKNFLNSIEIAVVRTLNEKKLSKRLTAVSQQLLQNKVLADIGTDHAYLPCYAYLNGIIPSAIGTEINVGPYQSARSLVKKLGLSDFIDIRFGDGLSVLRKCEAEQIVIAGMGGALITKILEEGKAKLGCAERLILQPNVAVEKVRRWLYENKWTIKEECILEEDDVIYEIVTADRGRDTRPFHKNDFLFGPYLLKKKSAVFRKKWAEELKKQQLILSHLNQAERSAEVDERRIQVESMIQRIKEALQ